jgi:hypothetical protein
MTTQTPAQTPAQRLVQEAREAAELRSYQTHPDVVALKVERIRTIVDRLIWGAVILGLAFTAVNVQQFAAGDADKGTLEWFAAWLLDPMVSLVVVGILLAESVTSRWQVRTGRWVRIAKWGSLGATYVMNTWESWAVVLTTEGAQGWDAVVLHSVPPLLVLAAAEAITDLRDKLTEAVRAAAHSAAERIAAERADEQTAHDSERRDAQPEALTDAAPITAQPVSAPTVVSTAPVSAPLVPPAPLTEQEKATAAALLDVPITDLVFEDGQLVDAAAEVVPTAPAADRRPLHLVAPLSHDADTDAVPAASQQASVVETTDETDPETLMRAFWDREVGAGRVPTGADLARAAQPHYVSSATGRRRRATWEAELVGATAGGAR